MRVLFRTLVGSQLYGLATPESDRDYLGFGIPSPSEIVGLSQPLEQTEEKTSEYEDKVYSLQKYFRLCLKGNPQVIEAAFAGPKYCHVLTVTGNVVLAFVRENFLTKHLYKSYTGYMKAQREQITKPRPDSKRAESIAKYGMDCKAASHALRLAYQCRDLFKNGMLNPTLSGVQQSNCLNVKNGLWSLDRIEAVLTQLELDKDEIFKTSTLPESVDVEKANSFLMSVMLNGLKGEGWTPVEEGLPPQRIRVLASDGELDPGNDCYIDNDGVWKYSRDEAVYPRPITHWQALPSPPFACEWDIANLGLSPRSL